MESPMNFRNIPFSPPDISELEIKYVSDVLRSGWITTGPRVKELECKLADYCRTDKMVCLASATAAEELNLRVCGIGVGDEVIVPAYTYTSTASAVLHAGAKVVFADSQPNGVEPDYDKLESLITEKTKAIVAVDLGGKICDYDRIYRIVNSKKGLFNPSGNSELGRKIQSKLGRIIVMADSAHALGASRDGKPAGSIADFTSFSFHAVKNLTTAEGGASTWKSIDGIDNEEIYRQFQLYSLHGQSKDAFSKTRVGSWEYDIAGAWYKCNMTDMAAALGLAQFERYGKILARRKEIIKKYDAVCDAMGIGYLKHFDGGNISSGHLYITNIPGVTDEQRREIIEKMAQRGISCNVHYKPLPMMTAYKELGADIKDFPNAYDFYGREITLPLHTKLSDDDVEYVTDNFAGILGEYGLKLK